MSLQELEGLEHVGMVPQDHVTARLHQGEGDVPLPLRGQVLVFVAPVDAHHDQISPAPGLAHGFQGRFQIQGAHPGLGGSPVQVEVEDVREAQEGDPEALALDDLESFSLGTVHAAANWHEVLRPQAVQGFTSRPWRPGRRHGCWPWTTP